MQLNTLIARGDSELQQFEKWDTEAVSGVEAGSPPPLQVCTCFVILNSHLETAAVQNCQCTCCLYWFEALLHRLLYQLRGDSSCSYVFGMRHQLTLSCNCCSHSVCQSCNIQLGAVADIMGLRTSKPLCCCSHVWCKPSHPFKHEMI